MTEPKRLTDEDLAAIEQRAERVNLDRLNPFEKEIIADLLCLVTEVRRLRELINQYEALAFLSKKMAEGVE